jgi:hypothetical protein
MFDEKIALIQWSYSQYGLIVCNADWSAIWWGSATSTPYTMLAYYNTTDLTYNYEYYAESIPWSLTSNLVWRCFRIQNDKTWNFISKKWAWTAFNNLGDETSVKALTYN